jgi:hypothetical protein
MILPNGRFCLIREKFLLRPGGHLGSTRRGGELLVVAHYWRSEADHAEHPLEPVATCDEFITQPGVGVGVCNELTDWAKSCGVEIP